MAWESDQRNSEPYAALRPLTAFARAYSAFRVITHETVAETLERRDLQMQPGNKLPKIHGLFYACLHKAERPLVRDIVVRRLVL